MTANLSPCKCGNTEFQTILNDDYLSSEDREITVSITLKCTDCDKEYWSSFDLRRTDLE